MADRAEKSRRDRREPHPLAVLAGVLAAFLLLAACYVGYQALHILFPQNVYETALPATVSDNVEADGVLLFDEVYVSGSGTLGYLAADGERVSAGTAVAEIYSDASQAVLRQQLTQLTEQIDLLQRSQNTTSLQLDTLLRERSAALYDMMDELDAGAYDEVSSGANAYVLLDCRIIVINKQNGGISEARRIGVNRARGKYIQYLDCDDVLMSNAIGCLVNRAEETQADVVVAPFFFCEDGGRKESDSMEFEQMSGIEYLKCILCSRAYWAMWTKFHLRSLYDEGIERLGISFGEDVALSTQILVRSGKVVSINTPILDYYVYSSSVSHDLGERAYLDFNVYVRWFDDYIERNGLHEEFARELALFHIKNTQARLHWKKAKDVNKEMNRLMIGLGDYPEFWKLLSRREKKIVTTYRLSSLLGYWRLYYYNWKNKL